MATTPDLACTMSQRDLIERVLGRQIDLVTYSLAPRERAPNTLSAIQNPDFQRPVSVWVMALTSLIETRAGIRSGKPCFVGTRIAVYDVLEYLAAGMTPDQITSDFPELTTDHVRAALEFAALRERRLATA